MIPVTIVPLSTHLTLPLPVTGMNLPTPIQHEYSNLQHAHHNKHVKSFPKKSKQSCPNPYECDTINHHTYQIGHRKKKNQLYPSIIRYSYK